MKKKIELETIRKEEMKGNIIRSRVQWLVEGEKPSKFFCALEHRNYIEKNIRKVTLDNGQIITDQKTILLEMKNFYQKLYNSKDDVLIDTNLEDLLRPFPVNKLTENESNSIEGEIKMEELSLALKNMKNNKTPGIDGFPAEFFKVFWSKIKSFILRSINNGYKQGKMSNSFRQCIITCLPKGKKQREFLKNWRPIALLSVTYKLASSVIASRVKLFLEKIITNSQTGFITGRFIGDSTRLVYDIMSFAENNNIDGLLMLIDFEKAFDSISWNFMYKTLTFFGFKESILKWITLFNTDINARILQAGYLSDDIHIKRGCRQGDPISAYLFIICTQIMYFLLQNNIDIHGITIDGDEYKLTQFADDTTIFLDGSQGSLQATLNTIEIFGNISGLKMNTEKTKLIWIGRKKYSKEKLKTSFNLHWGNTTFTLLGIQFSVDLQIIPTINYDSAVEKAKQLLFPWKKRKLTPIGKITVIKSFFLSKFNH